MTTRPANLFFILFVLMAGPGAANGGQDLLVVSVGNNYGSVDQEPLKYAENDARRLADLFVELGDARSDHVFVLAGNNPDQLTSVLSEVRGRTAELDHQGRKAVLLLYYAGHGDRDGLQMGSTRMSRQRLNGLLAQVPARLKLLIIDACQGTGGSRARGVTPAEAFDISVAGKPASGTVVISSASPGEPAQESDQLGGAVFSHYFMSGLRGPADANGDSQVTLQESYAFAYARTLLRTAGHRDGIQHPLFDIDLLGAGPVVLTRIGGSSASMVFEPEQDVHYLVYRLPGHHILAEVPTRSDREIRLALPPGKFLLQRRGPDQYGVTRVELPWGGSQKIQPDSFIRLDYQRLAVRGGRIQINDWRVSAGYRTELNPENNAEWGHGAELSVGYCLGSLLLDLGSSLVYAPLSTPRYSGREFRWTLRASANLLFPGDWYSIRLGLGVAVQPTWQHLEDRDADRLHSLGYPTEQEHSSTGIGPQLITAFSASLLPFTAIQLKFTYTPVWSRTLTTDGIQPDVFHGLALGIGISRSF